MQSIFCQMIQNKIWNGSADSTIRFWEIVFAQFSVWREESVNKPVEIIAPAIIEAFDVINDSVSWLTVS